MSKRLVLAVAVVIAVLANGAAAHAASLLYPDLKVLPPRYLRLDTTDVSGSDSGATGIHNVLRFSNTVWNAGQGPLLIRGHIDPTTQRGPAFQRILDTDGNYTERATGATIYWHAAHQHYHLDHYGAYQLWKASDYDAWLAGGSTGPQATGSKTSSCLIDEEFVSQVPGASWPGTFGFQGCSTDANGDLIEGLSVGWGDTYDYWRSDQWIDLGPGGKLADGAYVLRSIADPDNVLWESPGGTDTSRDGQSANAAITRFSVSGGQLVDSNPPTGTVMINNADGSTATPAVTVKALGRDDISGVDKFRLSDDGQSWATFTNDSHDSTPSAVSWDLSNPAYGGNSSIGTKTVYAQFHDAAGNWGPTTTDTIQLLAPGSPSAYAQAVAASGPVSWWRLGEPLGQTAARDEMGANNGTYMNNPTLGAQSLLATDASNTAASFDGTSSFMQAASSTSLNLGTAITLEAWIKPSVLPTTGQFASILSKPESYSLQLNGPKLEFTVMQNGARQRLQAPAGTIAIGQTYHVVGTYDGSTERLYVNGVQVGSQALTGPASTTANGVYVGSWGGGQEFFTGVIDDPAVYAKTLTAAQVKAHWDTGQGNQATAPAAPSNLTAAATSNTTVDLHWQDNSNNESSFIVERSTDAAFTAPTQLDVANDRTSLTDSGLGASTTYWYRVKARNPVGISNASNVASATTQATPPSTPPAAPTSLGAVAASDTRVDLSWTDASSNESSFVVERSSDASFTSPQPTTLPANTTGWSDNGRTASTTYWYRVKAVNAAGPSAYSNVATVTTKPPGGSYASAVGADAPVSYWRLGEAGGTVAADQRGANPGTYLGSPGLGAGSLLASDSTNSAVAFNGLSHTMDVPHSNGLDLTSAFTLEAWIKPGLLPAAGSFASIVTKPESYSLQFNGPRLEFTVMQSGVRKRLQAPAGALQTGQVYHVVATYDGATQRLYLNGSQVASAALTGPASITPSDLLVGSWDGAREFFNGTIDEVAVYGQALAAGRIGAHFTAGSGGAPVTSPNAPSGLIAAAPSDTQVDLSWVDNSANESSFVVERSSDASFTSPQPTTLPANTTSWSDSGRSANTTYWYRVKAVNGPGSSGYSNVASATTKAPAGSYSATVIADAPVSFWRLGDTSGTAMTDQRGANPGSYLNSPGLGAASLLTSDSANRAVSFDGLNDYATAPDSSSLDLTSAFTLEAWIKPGLLPAAGSFASIVTKPESYSLQFNGPRLEFTVMQSGVRKRLQAPAGALQTGQVYHVVATYDGATQRLYVNGSQVASGALSGAASVTTTAVCLGSWDGAREYFSGTIDEVAVYNQALSAARVSAHRAAGSATGTAAASATPGGAPSTASIQIGLQSTVPAASTAAARLPATATARKPAKPLHKHRAKKRAPAHPHARHRSAAKRRHR